MDCPRCHQPMGIGPRRSACPLCGFDLQPWQARMVALYTVSSGFFFSILFYAGLVYLMEQQADLFARRGHVPPSLAYWFLGVSVIIFGLATQVLGRRTAEARTADRLQNLMIMRMALVEAIAILGLLLYILGHSLEWFVILGAIAFVAFALLAAQVPAVARRLGELSVAEQSPNPPNA